VRQIAELHASIVEACSRNPEIDTAEARLAIGWAVQKNCDLAFDEAASHVERAEKLLFAAKQRQQDASAS
jgi:hypothetical protein